MVDLLRIACLLAEDAFRLVLLLFRSAEAMRAENHFLRRQQALYIERWTPGVLVRAKSVLGGLHHEYSISSMPALP